MHVAPPRLRVGIDVRVADPLDPGQQRYLWRLGRWLGKEGHEVHFLTVRHQRPEVESPGNTTLHRLHSISRKRLNAIVSGLALDTLLLNPERSPLYRGIQANVLRAGYGTDHYLQKLRSFRNPVWRGVHGALRLTPCVLAERRWERAFYERSHPAPEVIAQSGYMRAQILGSYRVPKDHVHVIHNAIDTTEFSPSCRGRLREKMRSRWSIPDDAFCLLFLGHNFRLKGLWQILAALPRIRPTPRQIHLLVGGRGTGHGQRWTAARLVRNHHLGNRVTLAGPIQPSLHAFAAADALIHLSWHDSFGFVPLEAMACGLPVITTHHAGVSEVIEDRVSGILVDPGSDSKIIEAVQQLCDPDERARMGTAASQVGRRYEESANFRHVLRVLEVAYQRGSGPNGL